MNCRKCKRGLSAYIDGELAGVEQLQIRAHVGQCDECSNEYESLVCTKRLLSSLTAHEPRANLETSILAKLDAAEKSQGIRWRLNGLWTVQGSASRLRVAISLCGVTASCIVIAIALTPQPKGDSAREYAAAYRPTTVPPIRRQLPLGELQFLHDTSERTTQVSDRELISVIDKPVLTGRDPLPPTFGSDASARIGR